MGGGKYINPARIEGLAKILWDITYLCWNKTILALTGSLGALIGGVAADPMIVAEYSAYIAVLILPIAP